MDKGLKELEKDSHILLLIGSVSSFEVCDLCIYNPKKQTSYL